MRWQSEPLNAGPRIWHAGKHSHDCHTLTKIPVTWTKTLLLKFLFRFFFLSPSPSLDEYVVRQYRNKNGNSNSRKKQKHRTHTHTTTVLDLLELLNHGFDVASKKAKEENGRKGVIPFWVEWSEKKTTLSLTRLLYTVHHLVEVSAAHPSWFSKW